MTVEQQETERLRGAFATLSEGAEPSDDCPEPERLWKAIRGELTATERGQLVEHTVTCGACAEAWRLGRILQADLDTFETDAEEDEAAHEDRKPARRVVPIRRYLQPVLAMAAVLAVVAVGIRFTDLPGGPSPAEYRAVDDGRIRSLIETESLPRDAFELQWSDEGKGSVYDLEAGTESLELVSLERGITDASFEIPAEKLAHLDAGSKILWRVNAVLPDGGRLSSPTFETLIE